MRPGWLNFPYNTRLMIKRVRHWVHRLSGIIKSKMCETSFERGAQSILPAQRSSVPGLKWDAAGSLGWLQSVFRHTSYPKDGDAGAPKCQTRKLSPARSYPVVKATLPCFVWKPPGARPVTGLKRRYNTLLPTFAPPSFWLHWKQKGGYWTCRC